MVLLDVSGGEVALEQVGQQIIGGLSSGSELVLSDFDKSIELVNVTLELLQLGGERGEVLTEDASGGLGVNEGLPHNHFDEERGAWHVIDVPVRVPDLHLAKPRESEGSKDAFDNLDVDLCGSVLTMDVSGAEKPEVLHGELAMVEGEVLQILKGLVQVLRDLKVPATGGAAVAQQGQESLEAAGVHIVEVGRVLKEGPGGLAVDGQSLPGGVINDALGVSRDKCKLNRRGFAAMIGLKQGITD